LEPQAAFVECAADAAKDSFPAEEVVVSDEAEVEEDAFSLISWTMRLVAALGEFGEARGRA
jgi:hypothetical protein